MAKYSCNNYLFEELKLKAGNIHDIIDNVIKYRQSGYCWFPFGYSK
jgi:hypothetical protein